MQLQWWGDWRKRRRISRPGLPVPSMLTILTGIFAEGFVSGRLVVGGANSYKPWEHREPLVFGNVCESE